MELIRVESKKIGIRYITPDCKYRIRKMYKKAYWEISKFTGNEYVTINSFKYFKDARKYLKEMIGG